jgi:hypothetical protein
MRILGWMASAVGLFGVVACNALAPLFWVLRADLRSRSRALLAVPKVGLEAAATLTDTAASWLDDASDHIGAIRAKADALSQAPVVDPAATAELATAIDAFLDGPYASLRTVYAGLRERAVAASGVLDGIRGAVPGLAIVGVVADRLEAIDARMLEIDATMTRLGSMDAAGLTAPGVAATISERAANAGEHLQTIGELVTEVEAWLQESRDRVDAADRRTGRLLTAGAIVGTVFSLFVAGLNVLLFQQGRRWSRR